MRKGLKRSGLLLIATGILALAYQFGTQTGSPPYEPTPYDPADLAPPTPLVEDAPATAPVIPESNEPNKLSAPQAVSAVSRKVKIIAVNSAPVAAGSGEAATTAATKVVTIQATSAPKDAPMKSAAPLSAGNSQEETATPVQVAIRRRPIDDDDVAWHVIESPSGNSSRGSSTGASLFSEPGTLPQGIPNGDPLQEAPKPVKPGVTVRSDLVKEVITNPAESPRRQVPVPQPAKDGIVPNQVASPPPAAPPVLLPKNKLEESKSSTNSPISGRSSRLADDAAPPAAATGNTSPPSSKPTLRQPESEPNTKSSSSTKSSSRPSTAPLTSPKPAQPSFPNSSLGTRVGQDATVMARSPIGDRSPDPSARSAERLQAAPKINPRKTRIIGLYPKYPEATTPAQASKAKIGDLEPKPVTPVSVTPVSVTPRSQSWLPPVSTSFAGIESSPDLGLQNHGEHGEPGGMKNAFPSVPCVPRGSLPTTAASSPALPVIRQSNPTVSTKPPSAPIRLPVVLNGKPATLDVTRSPAPATTVAPPEKQAVPSLGVVFLPPAELPPSVMASATEIATQKLMARSLGSPTGVAARLAHAKVGSSGPDGSELILAGGLMDYEGSPVDEKHPGTYSTTGVVNLTASKEEIAAHAHLDYVTNGVVILGASEELTITSPKIARADREQELKRSIQAACGDRVKDLEVALDSDQGRPVLRICLHASWKDEQELRQSILALPALADYKVNLSIQVSR